MDWSIPLGSVLWHTSCRVRLKCDGTRAETRFRLSAKRTSPFKSAGESVQSTTGSRGGVRGSAVCWGTALQVGRSRVRFPMVSLEFFSNIILPVALWPWGWLSLWQKWVPGIFPGGKGGRCVGLKSLSPSCDDCLEIWEPQPPRTLRACPGL